MGVQRVLNCTDITIVNPLFGQGQGHGDGHHGHHDQGHGLEVNSKVRLTQKYPDEMHKIFTHF